MMWREKYKDDMSALFEYEQDYVDFIFMLIIMHNFGVWYVDARRSLTL